MPSIMPRARAPSSSFREATQISPEGQGYISTPGIHSAEQIEGWKCVTKAVYVAGGHIVLQLWHVGRISHPSLVVHQFDFSTASIMVTMSATDQSLLVT